MNQNSIRGTSRLAALILASGILFIGAASKAAETRDDHEDAASLVGTWRITAQLVNCSTGQPIGKPFQSLLSFALGGTETDTTVTTVLLPAVRSPGHGVWSAQGGRTYSTSSTAFITHDGVLVQTQTVTQFIEMEEDDLYTSTAKVEFFDLSGALLRTGCATAVGHRFSLR